MFVTPEKFCAHHATLAGRSAGTHVYGHRGEEFVATTLVEQGWQILGRNVRTIGSEIDIIALKQDCLIFVEVKSRRTMPKSFEELLSHRKKTAIAKGAKHFLAAQNKQFFSQVGKIRADLVLLVEKKPPFYRWFVNAIALDE